MMVELIRRCVHISAGWKFGPLERPFTQVMLLGITVYQWLLSPLLKRECLFQPSCSQYAKDMLSAHGWSNGMPKFFDQYDDCCGTYTLRFHKTGVVLIGKSGTLYPAERVSSSIANRLTMGLPPEHVVDLGSAALEPEAPPP